MGQSDWKPPAAVPSPSAPVPIRVSNRFSKTGWTAPLSLHPHRPPWLPAMPISEALSIILHHKEKPMLTHPTLDKLQALKLMGMYHAFLEQMQIPEITEVPF